MKEIKIRTLAETRVPVIPERKIPWKLMKRNPEEAQEHLPDEQEAGAKIRVAVAAIKAAKAAVVRTVNQL